MPPHQLKAIQYISSGKAGYENAIAEAINAQIEKLGGVRQKIQEEKDVYWSFRMKREFWEGLPGYEYEAQLIDLTSETYHNLNEISEFIRGEFLDDLFRLRQNKISQSTESHSYADDKWHRTDTFNASCADPTIKNRVISIKYIVSWYGAGAAHPNHHFTTFCFILDPLVQIKSLRQIFEDNDQAIGIVAEMVIGELLKKELDDGELTLDEEWVRSGIVDWESFPAFTFRENGIEFLFPPYQIGPYAAGAFDVEIPYKNLVELISREYKVALGIQYLR